mmetsp:Transcript_809/g.1312  ORF Transcript_809/g.1312 Transcript_809/m.1312 type:complete len:85 (-) Transcript_809:245-499(-)
MPSQRVWDFIPSPQNTWTIERVAAVTGSEKSPLRGDTTPTTGTVPSSSGELRQGTHPAHYRNVGFSLTAQTIYSNHRSENYQNQ